MIYKLSIFGKRTPENVAAVIFVRGPLEQKSEQIFHWKKSSGGLAFVPVRHMAQGPRSWGIYWDKIESSATTKSGAQC